MPEGLKYCGNCGVHMNRAVYMFQWLFSKKGLPVLIVILALIIGAAAWFVIPKLRVPTIEFDLDMGWYTPRQEDIVYHDDSKTFGYVRNMILVFFTKDATDEQIMEVIESVDGELLGILPGVRQYQIQVPAGTEEELEQLRKQLMEFDVVKNAVIDYVATVEGETASAPNDPWKDYPGIGYSASWDESSPGGTNWWIEATKVLSAWSYREHFSHIDVGIVDNGYDTTHEDLNLVILNPEVNNSEGHGTHVAGIMGATADNGVGITGVLKDTTLYCVDCYATEQQEKQQISVSSLLAGIDLCIMNGSRVVNMSSGLIYDYALQYPSGVEQTAKSAITYLIMMIDAYDRDFIVVQSAGNGDNDHIAVDARAFNGWFASITPELVESELARMMMDGVKLEKDITVDDVMNSLMVIGAVDVARVHGTYQLSEFSNYGDTITVCAPGVNILSTVPTGNGYAYYNGTSMASPLAAAITAMVWSVDQEMSAGQVKEIVVSTADIPVLSRNGNDHGEYYMVNALAAVEKALAVVSLPEETEPEIPEDPTEWTEPENPTEPVDQPRRLEKVATYNVDQLFRDDVFSYDALGRITAITTRFYNSDGSVNSEELTYFTYDEANRLILAETPENMQILAPTKREYTYDGDRLVHSELTEGGWLSTDYHYDSEGILIESVGEHQVGVDYTLYYYDDQGLLKRTTTTTVYSGTDLADTYEDTYYYYDDQNRLIRREILGEGGFTTIRYDDSYPIFTFEEITQGAELKYHYLSINDPMGHNIWAQYLMEAEITTDEDGYIVYAYDSAYEQGIHLTYSGSVSTPGTEEEMAKSLLAKVDAYRREYITYTPEEVFSLYAEQLEDLMAKTTSGPGETLELGNVTIDSYKYHGSYSNSYDSYIFHIKYHDRDRAEVFKEELYVSDYRNFDTEPAPYSYRVVDARMNEVFSIIYNGQKYDCLSPGRTGTEGHYQYWTDYEIHYGEYLRIDAFTVVRSLIFRD